VQDAIASISRAAVCRNIGALETIYAMDQITYLIVNDGRGTASKRLSLKVDTSVPSTVRTDVYAPEARA
jgi:hypothetical protein